MKVECPSCGRGLNVPDRAAGKRGKCPACGASVPIPAPVAVAAVCLDVEDDPYGRQVETFEPIAEPAPARIPIKPSSDAIPSAPGPPAVPAAIVNGNGQVRRDAHEGPREVVLVGIRIPFVDMVNLMLTWTFASLVAVLIIGVGLGAIGAVLATIVSAFNGH